MDAFPGHRPIPSRSASQWILLASALAACGLSAAPRVPAEKKVSAVPAAHPRPERREDARLETHPSERHRLRRSLAEGRRSNWLPRRAGSRAVVGRPDGHGPTALPHGSLARFIATSPCAR